MKQKLKAFTLVELVIVMGMFTIIMFSVLQLLDPVSKFFVRSSNFEYTTACVDNIKRAVDGNLKYADRVRLYYGFDPYDQGVTGTAKCGTAPFDTIRTAVNRFYSEFFYQRVCTATSGNIYVMTFDNRVKNPNYRDLQQLSAYNEGKFNRGEIDLFEFRFDNYDPNLCNPDDVANQTPGVKEWYVNESLYGNFDYVFSMDTTGSALSFDPRNFQMNIDIAEVRKAEGGGLMKSDATNNASISFSMKNVLDVTTGNSSVDYRITLPPGIDEATALPTDFQANEVQRYIPFNGGDYSGLDWRTPSAEDLASNDMDRVLDSTCFFFVFTVPEQIFDGGDYVDRLNGTPIT